MPLDFILVYQFPRLDSLNGKAVPQTHIFSKIFIVLLKFMPKSRFENYLSGQILNCELINPCFTQYRYAEIFEHT